MFYPIDPNDVITSNMVYYPAISMSFSDKFYLRDTNNNAGYQTNYLRKIHKAVHNNSVFVYSDLTYESNLTASIDKQNYSTTTNKSVYGSYKQLCGIYESYDYNYHNDANFTTFTAIQLSNIIYGSRIQSGSFVFDDNTAGIRYYDDARGLIWKQGAPSTKAGKIFYAEGICVITASAEVTALASSTNYGLQLTGSYLQPKVMINMTIRKQQANCSSNPSYFTTSGDTRTRILTKQEVFFDRVYLYNSKKEMIGICKTSQPIRKSNSDNLIVRINYAY